MFLTISHVTLMVLEEQVRRIESKLVQVGILNMVTQAGP